MIAPDAQAKHEVGHEKGVELSNKESNTIVCQISKEKNSNKTSIEN